MIAAHFSFENSFIQNILQSISIYPEYFRNNLKHFLIQIFQKNPKERISFPLIKQHRCESI
jgi:hypothetical protein